jgi:hypothetical protein
MQQLPFSVGFRFRPYIRDSPDRSGDAAWKWLNLLYGMGSLPTCVFLELRIEKPKGQGAAPQFLGGGGGRDHSEPERIDGCDRVLGGGGERVHWRDPEPDCARRSETPERCALATMRQIVSNSG